MLSLTHGTSIPAYHCGRRPAKGADKPFRHNPTTKRPKRAERK